MRPLPPQVHVALAGSTEFFHNRIQVIASLNSVPRQAQDRENKQKAKSRRPSHDSGQGRGRGQGRGPSDRPSPSNRGSQQPPVTLNVTFTNQGSTALNLSIREINSVLGNFVAQPDHATLAPGESVELEPMISRMGIISGSISLQVELNSEGQTESKTITLKEELTTQ